MKGNSMREWSMSCVLIHTQSGPTHLGKRIRETSMSQFKPGDPRTKTGGRRKGSRDRIETKMLEAIARDFEEHGEEAIRICRVERPNEYLKLVASLLPREL